MSMRPTGVIVGPHDAIYTVIDDGPDVDAVLLIPGSFAHRILAKRDELGSYGEMHPARDADETGEVPCPRCDGSGAVETWRRDDAGVSPECPACEGHGTVASAANALLIRVLLIWHPPVKPGPAVTSFATPERVELTRDIYRLLGLGVPAPVETTSKEGER